MLLPTEIVANVLNLLPFLNNCYKIGLSENDKLVISLEKHTNIFSEKMSNDRSFAIGLQKPALLLHEACNRSQKKT